jgi:hypothetical protein
LFSSERYVPLKSCFLAAKGLVDYRWNYSASGFFRFARLSYSEKYVPLKSCFLAAKGLVGYRARAAISVFGFG